MVRISTNGGEMILPFFYYGNALLFDLLVQEVQCGFQKGADIQGPLFGFLFSDKTKELLNDQGDALGLGKDNIQIFTNLFLIFQSSFDQFRPAINNIERGPDLVGQTRGQLADGSQFFGLSETPFQF